ncbi:MAG: U32 family peptidase [Coprobacillus sp.]|nr:U32 family peptidase [Coprobacillus sp.]MDY4144969.1 U32 family peptidase [Bacilli bacterium]
MNKIELLAPAGNLEKLKIAYLYGADAVYAGGKYFSLRARASNFDLEDIKKASQIAQELGKKFYVTMNIVPHDGDLENLEEYLRYLESVNVTGIIVSSLYIANVSKRVSPKLERHLSTQDSVNNSLAIKYYEGKGFSRVVLARETSISEIRKIKDKTKIQLEVFIHGGMCTSFSGRCMLSNYLTQRDANRGGCAHSCRWNYDVYDEDLQKTKSYLNIGSKDLCAINYISDLIDINVDSLKIEGRMKSLYYIAVVVRTYRKLIDRIYELKELNQSITKEELIVFENEILKAENRETSCGFMKGMVSLKEQLYNSPLDNPTKDFLGIVIDYDGEYVTLEQRNYFTEGTTVEFFGPDMENKTFVIGKITDTKGNVLDACRHPLEIVRFALPFAVKKYDMMRKK